MGEYALRNAGNARSHGIPIKFCPPGSLKRGELRGVLLGRPIFRGELSSVIRWWFQIFFYFHPYLGE